MSSNEKLLKNYQDEKNKIKLDIEREKDSLKTYRNRGDQAAAVACKEKIGYLRSNLRSIEDKIATLERIIKNNGIDPYAPATVNNAMVQNEIDYGTIKETYNLTVDIVGTKGKGNNKEDVHIGQSQEIVRTSNIENSNITDQTTTVTKNKLANRNKKQIPNKKEIVINVKPEENEKELMDKFLNEYKKCGSVNECIQSLGISKSQYNSWCADGRKKINKNATKFVNKLDRLKKSSRRVNLDSPSQKNYSKQYIDNTQQLNSSSIYKRSTSSNFESKTEKELMNAFLREYRRTKSVNESIKKSGISQKQYNSWCIDGKNNVSRNTMDFVNEIDKINRKSKLNPAINTINRNAARVDNNYSKSEIKKMEQVINYMLEGKTRAQAANSASISVSKINNWYKEGMSAKNEEVIKFYHKIRDIESYIKNHTYEKRKMLTVLNYLKMGKTYQEAANYAHINPSLINTWYQEGLGKKNPNAVYFYKTLKKIEDKSNKSKNISGEPASMEVTSFEIKQKEKMDNVLNFMKQGKSRLEASKLANIPAMTINNWYSQGSNHNNENTIYFYNQVNLIESENAKKEVEKIDSNLNQNKSNKSSENKHNVATKLIPLQLVESKNKVSNKASNENDFQKMGRFLEFQKDGKSVKEACKLVGISESKLNQWIDQGRNRNNTQAIYFVKEYDKFNQNEKDGEDIPINKKNKKSMVCPRCHSEIDIGQNFCHMCGHQLIITQKRRHSIFDKIRSLF